MNLLTNVKIQLSKIGRCWQSVCPGGLDIYFYALYFGATRDAEHHELQKAFPIRKNSQLKYKVIL